MSDRSRTDERSSHIMTVDVEDYFQVEAFAGLVDRASWNSRPSRVEGNVRRILDLLDEHSATATFFFLGWIAQRMPHLVREAANRGHEIACHSFWHRPIYQLTPEVFRQDTREAIHAIEDAAGITPSGYRAPTWSITQDSLWALDILLDEGFSYDSSIYPIHHDLYGIASADRTPYAWRNGSRFLFEFPPATVQLCNTILPAAGGGYLRIFPPAYTRFAIDQIAANGHQAVIYFHPWEIDQDQPRLAGSLRSRFRHYTGLKHTLPRLESLMRRYRFRSFAESWRSTSVLCRSQTMPREKTTQVLAS